VKTRITNQEIFAEKVIGNGLVTTEELTRGIAMHQEWATLQVWTGAVEYTDRNWGGFCAVHEGNEGNKYEDER
jgi:hypothetical protein